MNQQADQQARYLAGRVDLTPPFVSSDLSPDEASAPDLIVISESITHVFEAFGAAIDALGYVGHSGDADVALQALKDAQRMLQRGLISPVGG